MKRLTILAMLSALPLAAGRIDVSGQETALVHSGASILIDFAVWNYAVNNPGVSPYPTGLNFTLLTQAPGIEASTAGGSSATYYDDYRFSAALESRDGGISVPLTDSLAGLLGLGRGTLVLAPGTHASGSSGETAVGVLSGSATLSPETAAALFGSELAARIVLHNLGPDVVIGIGEGYTVRNAVSEPGLTGEGERSVGGLTGTVTVANPEPGTWGLAAGALLMAFAARRARSRGAGRCQ